MILQLKTGKLEASYFRRKFGVEILEEFADTWKELEKHEILNVSKKDVRVTADGLLQIDRCLPSFFEPEFRTALYVKSVRTSAVLERLSTRSSNVAGNSEARDALILTGADERFAVTTVKRIGNHQVGLRLPAQIARRP